ncbi:MAG TPA: hypothetical protein VFM79_08075, partial [Pelobium sp.]|nr:hypothetical protein [Pelobium sp.]
TAKLQIERCNKCCEGLKFLEYLMFCQSSSIIEMYADGQSVIKHAKDKISSNCSLDEASYKPKSSINLDEGFWSSIFSSKELTAVYL